MSFRIDPDTLDFELPEGLIAQTPLAVRDQARLLVLERKTGALSHRRFSDLRDYLREGDVLVLNKAKVSRAKLVGKKVTGGKVELIFIERLNGSKTWRALVRPLMKEGTEVLIGPDTAVQVAGRFPSGEYQLHVQKGDIEKLLTKEGRLPLPPYIKRDPNDQRHLSDQADYQTVYASQEGSVAAPTAGLHFSESLLKQLKEKGVQVVEILLHVGWGTFRPIASTVASHTMLAEKFEVSRVAFESLLKAKKDGRRIISVGTTSTRTLESLDPDQPLQDVLMGETSLFIKPGFKFRWVDSLITNLHVPRSTPVSLTATFAGLQNLERAYAAAIQENYRFYSYGDAMLIY